MKISEAMTRDVAIASPDQTIQEAAQMMADADVGLLPVGDNDRLVGMVTDRDIAIRAVASGKGPDSRVSEVMTTDVKYCFDDEDTDAVAQNMGEQQIRRIPVVNRDKRLVGIVSLSDLANGGPALDASDALVGQTLGAIARPGGPHSHQAEARG